MITDKAVSSFISSTINSASLTLQNLDLYNDVFGTNTQLGHGPAMAESSGTQLMKSLLFSLSILKDKIHKFESFVNNNFLVQGNFYNAQPMEELALSSMAHLMQEIIESASCVMLNCEQMALGSSTHSMVDNNVNIHHLHEHQQQVLVSQNAKDDALLAPFINKVDNNGDSFCNWFTPDNTCTTASKTASIANTTTSTTSIEERDGGEMMAQEREVSLMEVDDIVEIEASDLLARYTHYCQVCGRGFKREANLRMHMRAHGDRYKSSSLMSKKSHLKNLEEEDNGAVKLARRYSCPQQGCRWNKKHAKFQPLKSIVCVRNHYKRSHCPKIFVCKKCNTKQFSVLSDLKTHEKHCGEVTKWVCSCGTGFSKKDKLMDHVALFVGHTPLIDNPYSAYNQAC